MKIGGEDLAGAAEILSRLAAKLDAPNAAGRVVIPIEKRYFWVLQRLLEGTEWKGRFCWLMGTSTDDRCRLSVDVRPPPVVIACPTCGGTGVVEQPGGTR